MIEETKLAKIGGASNVSRERATLDEYSSDMSFVNSIEPECVVKPRNAGDVDKIVNLARETLTSLVPVSSGPPHFRADTVPGIGGAHDFFGPYTSTNYHVWMKKIKKAFDPVEASDPSMYISGE